MQGKLLEEWLTRTQPLKSDPEGTAKRSRSIACSSNLMSRRDRMQLIECLHNIFMPACRNSYITSLRKWPQET
ncbi:Hypothetical predicted protein [Podarcis lilfordi]|uniref:Uncharacterized protein n=1 Tax=Podarcis lilfordi TaxID=74358 RepID=A0AA35KAS2_9SAUR|nr:Hypothetical predicted protein [Podarcis lilfordi]